APREYRQEHRDHPGGGKEDDVDPGMAEEPEEMLPEHRVAAGAHVEEVEVPLPIELEEDAAYRQGGHGEDGEEGGGPGAVEEQRHARDAHARRAVLEDGGYEVDGSGGVRDREEDQG